MRQTKYRCQICGRIVHEDHALVHVKADEYLIGLIKKDHPEWHEKDKSCPKCIAYYRELVNKAEI